MIVYRRRRGMLVADFYNPRQFFVYYGRLPALTLRSGGRLANATASHDPQRVAVHHASSNRGEDKERKM